MPIEREFVLLTATGRRLPTWLRVWLTIAAVATGAVMLWLGFLLAFAVFLTAAVALLPVWTWRSFRANRRPGEPATIEGEYTISRSSAEETRDEALGGNPTRDPG